MPTEISEPWKSFLSEIDSRLEEAVQLHCLGGFVLTTVYGLPRTTADVDVVAIATASSSANLIGLAGKGSELHRLLGNRRGFSAKGTRWS